MSEQRQKVSVRAKSVLKLDTGQSNLDYTYDKSAPIEGIVKDLIHALVFNEGLSKARNTIHGLVTAYEDGYRDPK